MLTLLIKDKDGTWHAQCSSKYEISIQIQMWEFEVKGISLLDMLIIDHLGITKRLLPISPYPDTRVEEYNKLFGEDV